MRTNVTVVGHIATMGDKEAKHINSDLKDDVLWRYALQLYKVPYPDDVDVSEDQRGRK